MFKQGIQNSFLSEFVRRTKESEGSDSFGSQGGDFPSDRFECDKSMMITLVFKVRRPQMTRLPTHRFLRGS